MQTLTLTDWRDVVAAIKDLTVRGAPAIGVAAAMGIALGTLRLPETSSHEFRESFEVLCEAFRKARPTARNLFWAIERMQRRFDESLPSGGAAVKKALVEEAIAIGEEDIEINRRIGLNGKAFIHDGDNILTHCNAGALATAGYGTALGVVRAAREDGKNLHVFVDETRPVLQGARLTCWELLEDRIPATLITDNMAGFLMAQGKVNLVIVGADRIAANGDTANKIGTYSLAILAREHRIPFYVAAPLSTIAVILFLYADSRLPRGGKTARVAMVQDAHSTMRGGPGRRPDTGPPHRLHKDRAAERGRFTGGWHLPRGPGYLPPRVFSRPGSGTGTPGSGSAREHTAG